MSMPVNMVDLGSIFDRLRKQPVTAEDNDAVRLTNQIQRLLMLTLAVLANGDDLKTSQPFELLDQPASVACLFAGGMVAAACNLVEVLAGSLGHAILLFMAHRRLDQLSRVNRKLTALDQQSRGIQNNFVGAVLHDLVNAAHVPIPFLYSPHV